MLQHCNQENTQRYNKSDLANDQSRFSLRVIIYECGDMVIARKFENVYNDSVVVVMFSFSFRVVHLVT